MKFVYIQKSVKKIQVRLKSDFSNGYFTRRLMYIYDNNNNAHSALGLVWQEPEPSQVIGMAPLHCILGKFLGVVRHLFPPRLNVPTFAARCLHSLSNAIDPSSERWNYGREMSGNFAYLFEKFFKQM
jgi:hypothetical protein